MNCPGCGAPVNADQTHCVCGQYLPRARPGADGPPEFFRRIENQAQQAGRDNFRRGLLIGAGALALFLFLELIMDTFQRALFYGIGEAVYGIALSLVAAVIGVNLWLLVRRYFI